MLLPREAQVGSLTSDLFVQNHNQAAQSLTLVRAFYEGFALSSTDAPLLPLPSPLPPSLLLLPDAMIV